MHQFVGRHINQCIFILTTFFLSIKEPQQIIHCTFKKKKKSVFLLVYFCFLLFFVGKQNEMTIMTKMK